MGSKTENYLNVRERLTYNQLKENLKNYQYVFIDNKNKFDNELFKKKTV